jgi:hypothetical protein
MALRWWDVALAAGIAAFAIGEGVLALTTAEQTRVIVGVEAVAAVLLTVRRVCPLVALTGALGLLGAVELVLGHYQSWASVLIALVVVYSAAAYATNLPYTLAVSAACAATLALGEPAGSAGAERALVGEGFLASNRS